MKKIQKRMNEWIIENLTATLAEIEKLWSSEADCEKKNT